MNIKDVENLAELAKIELTDEEKKSLLSDMEGILGYVRQIESVEVGETEQDHKLYNVWREDEVTPSEFSKELILKQFPDLQDGFLKSVPGSGLIDLGIKLDEWHEALRKSVISRPNDFKGLYRTLKESREHDTSVGQIPLNPPKFLYFSPKQFYY